MAESFETKGKDALVTIIVVGLAVMLGIILAGFVSAKMPALSAAIP